MKADGRDSNHSCKFHFVIMYAIIPTAVIFSHQVSCLKIPGTFSSRLLQSPEDQNKLPGERDTTAYNDN